MSILIKIKYNNNKVLLVILIPFREKLKKINKQFSDSAIDFYL